MSELTYIDRYIDTIDRTDDLISRADAIEIVKAMIDVSIDDSDMVTLAKVWSQLKDAPSAQPKQGEWKEREVFDNIKDKVIEEWQSARCSECGKYHTTPYMYYFDNFNFCPNCGARMNSSEKPNNSTGYNLSPVEDEPQTERSE